MAEKLVVLLTGGAGLIGTSSIGINRDERVAEYEEGVDEIE